MTTEPDLTRALDAVAGLLGRPLDDAQVRQIIRYLGLISEWSRKARLTAVTRPADAMRVHILDSLLCLRAGLPQGAAVVDVGSGAGLPGIPLKIARPDLSLTLLESAARKAAFLDLAVAELRLAAEVVEARAEDAGRDPRWRERFDIGVARAVAALPVLCELVLPFVHPGGKAVLLKGPAVVDEIDSGRRAAARLGGGGPAVIEDTLPGGIRRMIVVVEKTGTTPRGYPRRPGVPGKRPIS